VARLATSVTLVSDAGPVAATPPPMRAVLPEKVLFRTTALPLPAAKMPPPMAPVVLLAKVLPVTTTGTPAVRPPPLAPVAVFPRTVTAR
jgi:hypothetical protein